MKIAILGKSPMAAQLGNAFTERGVDVIQTEGEGALDVARAGSVEAVIVGVPLRARFSLALEALNAAKHVLVAGALRNPWEAKVLGERARAEGRQLAFALPALQASERVRLARLRLECEDVQLVTARLRWDGRDWSAVWDALANEVVRLQLLLDSTPLWVSAAAAGSANDGSADALSFTLGFDEDRLAQIQLVVDAAENRVTVHASQGLVALDPSPLPLERESTASADALVSTFAASAESAGAAPAGSMPIEAFRVVEAAERSLDQGSGESHPLH